MPWRFPPYPAESIAGHNVNKKENMYCPMVRRDLEDNLHQFIPDDTIYYRTHTQLWGLPVGEHDIRQPANGSPPWFPESSTKKLHPATVSAVSGLRTACWGATNITAANWPGASDGLSISVFSKQKTPPPCYQTAQPDCTIPMPDHPLVQIIANVTGNVTCASKDFVCLCVQTGLTNLLWILQVATRMDRSNRGLESKKRS